MQFLRKKGCFLLLVVAAGLMLIGGGTAGGVGNAGGQTPDLAADVNDLRWDLAKAFHFAWQSVEVSCKTVPGEDPRTPTRTLSISVKPSIVDANGLVSVDLSAVGIYELFDERGNSVNCQAAYSDRGRYYPEFGWFWEDGKAYVVDPLGTLDLLHLAAQVTSSPAQPSPSSISVLIGFVYGLYADRVVNVDIPFDPNSGTFDVPLTPDLQFWVDPATPPCPGPVKYVRISPPNSRVDVSRPATPVPLYMYTTWVKSRTGKPVLAINDGILRKSAPFGEYAVIRTELVNSKRGSQVSFQAQSVRGDYSGTKGAQCHGQMAPVRNESYDTIRHVIAVHPREMKIPFVLKNVPVPQP